MVRSFRIGALIAVLACTAPSWGQVLPQERYVTVMEDGNKPVKCKILKTWKDKAGNTVSQVQPENGGPVMTITEGPSAGDATPVKERNGFFSKIFRRSSERETIESVPVTTTSPPGRFGKVFSKNVSSTNSTTSTTVLPSSTSSKKLSIPATSSSSNRLVVTPTSSTSRKIVIPPPPSIKATTAQPPLATPEVVPAQPSDYRQSWGKVESSPYSASRTALPVAKQEKVDPINRPDVYVEAKIPVKSELEPVLPASTQTPPVTTSTPPAQPMPSSGKVESAKEPLLPVSVSSNTPSSNVVSLPSTSSASLPLPATTGNSLPSTPEPIRPVPVNSTVSSTLPAPCTTCEQKKTCSTCVSKSECKSCTSKSTCTTCQQKGDCATCKSKGDCSTCNTCSKSKILERPRFGRASESGVERPGIFAGLFQPTETIVVGPNGETTTTYERRGLLSHLKSDERIIREHKPRILRERPVRVQETVVSGDLSTPLISPLPRNEGRIGIFSGLNVDKSASIARQERRARNSTMPRGMASYAAAGSVTIDNKTPMGALVRQPDGSTSLVPAGQVDPRIPSIPVAASNAFTINQSSIPYVAMTPDQAANAWSMATPTRPIPADMGSVPVVPNGLMARGIGGAAARPPMAMAMAGYAPGYYYPPQMGYGYPVQPMLRPAVSLPAGAAVATHRPHPVTSQALATLRGAVMPSEREKAAETLAKSNWKSDPQIVPALVTAAQDDPAPTVRLTCLRALGQMKVNSEPVVEAVKTLRVDRDPRVRKEAEMVLPQLLKP